MSKHKKNRDGGKGGQRPSRETKKDKTPESLKRYALLTLDLEAPGSLLSIIPAETPQEAHWAIRSIPPNVKRYGLVELTPYLIECLRNILDQELKDTIASIPFNRCSGGEFKPGQVEYVPSLVGKVTENAQPEERQVQLFACLTESHLADQFFLLFVRASNNAEAIALIQGEVGSPEGTALFRISSKLISRLTQMPEVDRSDEICFFPMPGSFGYLGKSSEENTGFLKSADADKTGQEKPKLNKESRNTEANVAPRFWLIMAGNKVSKTLCKVPAKDQEEAEALLEEFIAFAISKGRFGGERPTFAFALELTAEQTAQFKQLLDYNDPGHAFGIELGI